MNILQIELIQFIDSLKIKSYKIRNMKYLIVLSILTVSLFLSCKSHKKAKEVSKIVEKEAQVVPKDQPQPSGRPAKILEFKKGACHGTCPVYTMTFLSNGTVYYEGEQFSEKMGVHVLQISQDEINDIMDRCSKEDFGRFPKRYKSMIPDWASNTIIYFGGKEPKSTTWRDESDPFLMSLQATIEEIEKRAGWKMEGNQSLPDHTISNQIIVDLDPKVEATQLVSKYRKYNLKVIKKIAPSSNLYVVEFDETKIPPYEILNLLIKDKMVIQAQFNKKISPRSR